MGEWKIMQEVWMLKEMTNQTNKIRRSSGSWERRKTRWNVLKIKNLVCVLKWNRNTAFLMHWSAYNHAHQTLYPNDLAVYLNDLHLCYNSCFTQSAVLVLLLAPTEPATCRCHWRQHCLCCFLVFKCFAVNWIISRCTTTHQSKPAALIVQQVWIYTVLSM